MDIEVDMGKTVAAGYREAENLTSTGIGSCLVITLYDPELKLGAISHPMLYRDPQSAGAGPDAVYLDTAIEQMLEKLLARGAVRARLEAKLVGAANMFSAFKPDIPSRNVSGARAKLRREGIRLVGECVGGSIGRSAALALDTGIVTVKTKF